MGKKSKINKLKDIFEELGMGEIGEYVTHEEAQMIAEEQGGGRVINDSKHNTQKCGGKICYLTKKNAELIKKKRQNKSGNSGRLVSYYCELCHSYHLTSTR